MRSRGERTVGNVLVAIMLSSLSFAMLVFSNFFSDWAAEASRITVETFGVPVPNVWVLPHHEDEKPALEPATPTEPATLRPSFIQDPTYLLFGHQSEEFEKLFLHAAVWITIGFLGYGSIESERHKVIWIVLPSTPVMTWNGNTWLHGEVLEERFILFLVAAPSALFVGMASAALLLFLLKKADQRLA